MSHFWEKGAEESIRTCGRGIDRILDKTAELDHDLCSLLNIVGDGQIKYYEAATSYSMLRNVCRI